MAENRYSAETLIVGMRELMRTIPELFIIESLTLEDEKAGRQEGELISRMLRLGGKTRTQYYYIRTEVELEEMIDLFDESNYRYLHISCHANSHGMALTFGDLSFSKLAGMLNPCLEDRRVFVSACEMANESLAAAILRETGCYSLIGPKRSIRFSDAAAFWVAFYHLIFKANKLSMKRETLRRRITELSAIFEEPINYFASSSTAKQGYTRVRNRTRVR
ncbi:hypothetical protein NYR58_16220 [Chelativorans intermedius]|nr:CHAT domain-containing protein [Chelativorans intermedius]MCT8999935.1 hypothetical protein [Chelativorans intermedius]